MLTQLQGRSSKTVDVCMCLQLRASAAQGSRRSTARRRAVSALRWMPHLSQMRGAVRKPSR